jgi:Fe-S-cluster containining protein
VSEAPWYLEGVRFGCNACGKCCVNHGEGFDFVFSTRVERKRIAERMGISLRRFEAEYCERVAGRLSFISAGQACVFLEDGQCSVYEQRPKQCRSFPFWPELMESRSTWDKDVASFCPGVGKGELHSFADIRKQLTDAGS